MTASQPAVPDELVERAQKAYREAIQLRDGYPHRIRAALSWCVPVVVREVRRAR